jgi:hypothetical protein
MMIRERAEALTSKLEEYGLSIEHDPCTVIEQALREAIESAVKIARPYLTCDMAESMEYDIKHDLLGEE